ncbi:hypothetical protein EYF80_056654 [Liparis tanakae]|uniref:Uncharacterized protein n=1 Tax=Liparis tanakae TaxID=230148 RepID=A0A4Z2EYA2_9TELE|nr:hypothetical protein EYF80_056654 [Liparis tanakae]
MASMSPQQQQQQQQVEVKHRLKGRSSTAFTSGYCTFTYPGLELLCNLSNLLKVFGVVEVLLIGLRRYFSQLLFDGLANTQGVQLPESFALSAHSDTSSCDLPSVNTTPTRATPGRAPSLAEKLRSNMWRRAEPVMEPRPMYCMRATACCTLRATLNRPRVNSVRTLVEYCRRPT